MDLQLKRKKRSKNIRPFCSIKRIIEINVRSCIRVTHRTYRFTCWSEYRRRLLGDYNKRIIGRAAFMEPVCSAVFRKKFPLVTWGNRTGDLVHPNIRSDYTEPRTKLRFEINRLTKKKQNLNIAHTLRLACSSQHCSNRLIVVYIIRRRQV